MEFLDVGSNYCADGNIRFSARGFREDRTSCETIRSIKYIIIHIDYLTISSTFILIARSPLFAYTNATVQGLTTIRAFNAEQILCKEFNAHLDRNTSASYQFHGVSRAFAVWVELTCAAYMAVSLCVFLAIGNGKCCTSTTGNSKR